MRPFRISAASAMIGEQRQRGPERGDAGLGVLVDDGVGRGLDRRRRRRVPSSDPRPTRTARRSTARSARLFATLSGTFGLFSSPVVNEAVSAAISTAPAQAVPIDAPRFVSVFCRPPTSPLCSSGTDETVTAPSCEAERADAETGQQHRPRHDLGAGPHLEQGDHHDDPGRQHQEAEAHHPARRRVWEQLGDADRGEQQRDRQRQQPHPGGDRRQAERDRQEQRDDEEESGLEQVLEEERRAGRPAGSRSAAWPDRSAALSPRSTR